MEYGEPQSLPISQNIVMQMSLSTIRNLTDAIVELVTNSDDSYKRLEQDNSAASNDIDVSIQREKGGFVRKLLVKDLAEGMDRPGLEKAIKFAEPASGIKEGKSVRGYFGRGLKEAIIALGRGRIDTIKNGIYDSAEVWWDKKKRGGQYCLLTQPTEASPDIRNKVGVPSGNGTVITINIDNPNIKCPDYNTFKGQLASHYALRDINSSPDRHIRLLFIDWKGVTTKVEISYSPPPGDLIESKLVKLGSSGDEIHVKIYKSKEQLDSPRNNPYAKAGFLIKTKGAILDLQLFKYESDEAGLYFFGEVFCPGIAERLKTEEQGLVDTNRGGLEWKHPYCHSLRLEIEKILAPYIDQKKKELEKKSTVYVSEKTHKILQSLCNLLNRFAKDEVELTKAIELNTNIEELMIKPEWANLEVGIPRSFSIYVPEPICPLLENGENIAVWSTNPNIHALCSAIDASQLSQHPKHPELLYTHFNVIGDKDGETGKIVCKIGEYSAFANAKVAPPGKSVKKKSLGGRWGGLFSGIEPDETPKPIQRVKYDENTGEIRIFINFPAVGVYIGPGLKGIETPEGKIILAELIGEAFCRQVAIKRREMGKDQYFAGAEIDTFNAIINELQRKYLHLIHRAIAL